MIYFWNFRGFRGRSPLGEGVAEDTANAIRDCRGPLQGPRNDNVVPWLKRGEGFPLPFCMDCFVISFLAMTFFGSISDYIP